MASSVPDLMARLRQTSSRLNHLSDEAATIIKATEEFLSRECSIGIECSVRIDFEDNEQWTWAKYLAYGRYNGRFRILVSEYFSESPDGTTSKPWSDCDRDTKISSIEFLPSLLSEIVKKAEAKVVATQCALSSVVTIVGPQQKKGG